MTADSVFYDLGVSRETRERLIAYAALVRKWSPAINLVSKSDLEQLETRHIADSLQLAEFLPNAPGTWADFGSGGGFPGIVVAILAAEQKNGLDLHLVESDQRKAAFLRTAGRELDLSLTVHCTRVEQLAPLGAATISARALAPLTDLLSYAHRHLAPGGRCVLLKGQTYEAEIDEARRTWQFDVDARQSVTDPAARILLVSNLTHA